jgi:hypothetical protein
LSAGPGTCHKAGAATPGPAAPRFSLPRAKAGRRQGTTPPAACEHGRPAGGGEGGRVRARAGMRVHAEEARCMCPMPPRACMQRRPQRRPRPSKRPPARLRLSRVRRGLEGGTHGAQTWAGSTPSNLLGRQSTMEVRGAKSPLPARGPIHASGRKARKGECIVEHVYTGMKSSREVKPTCCSQPGAGAGPEPYGIGVSQRGRP